MKNYEFGSGLNVVCSERGRGQGGPRYDADGHCVVMRSCAFFCGLSSRTERALRFSIYGWAQGGVAYCARKIGIAELLPFTESDWLSLSVLIGPRLLIGCDTWDSKPGRAYD